MQGERREVETSRDAAAAAAPATPPFHSADYARLLGRVDLFAGLERVTLAKLAGHLEPRSYKSNEIIFRQAEPGDSFYLVASGSVGVYVAEASGAGEVRMRVLGAGEPFG